ncbi:hypothetical protein TNCV_1833811 [Trichonephila clavipes]|nr:hypothetical protein TNCV_1833811 [Trichonephila clavipes]
MSQVLYAFNVVAGAKSKKEKKRDGKCCYPARGILPRPGAADTWVEEEGSSTCDLPRAGLARTVPGPDDGAVPNAPGAQPQLASHSDHSRLGWGGRGLLRGKERMVGLL